MKRVAALAILFVASVLLTTGCVVYSVQPWIGSASKTAQPAIAGTWIDRKESDTIFMFTAVTDSTGDYNVRLVQREDATKTFIFAASLHRFEGGLFLLVGPGKSAGEQDNPCLIPAHLLFRVVLQGGGMRLHAMDLESAEAAMQKAGLAGIPLGEKREDGYLTSASTSDLEAFLKTALKDAALFGTQPFYDLTKLDRPEAPAPTDATNAPARPQSAANADADAPTQRQKDGAPSAP